MSKDFSNNKENKNAEETNISPYLVSNIQSTIQPKIVSSIQPRFLTSLDSETESESKEQMPEEVQAKMENSFGQDFSNVNIHTDSDQAKNIGAQAYAQGNNIHFAPGQYNPGSKSGQELLGHELTHVVQQSQGKVQPGEVHGKGLNINNDPALEKEADEMGKLASEGKMTSVNQYSENSIQKKDAALPVDHDSTRKLVSDQAANVKIGTQLQYKLEQYAEELWTADTKQTFHWTVENDQGSSFMDQYSDTPILKAVASNPGTYHVNVQVLTNGVAVPGMNYTYVQDIYMEKKETELGGLSVGNFDFTFDGHTVNVVARVKFDFEDTIPPAEHAAFKIKFFNAIKNYWGNSGKKLECNTDKGVTYDIPINITSYEVTDSTYHKVVDVRKDERRSNVIDEINIYQGIDEKTIAHEFGHVLGLYDEYDGGFWENHMFWHDDGSHKDDTNALMVDGSEMRDRYFTQYQNAVESTSPTGYTYKIK